MSMSNSGVLTSRRGDLGHPYLALLSVRPISSFCLGWHSELFQNIAQSQHIVNFDICTSKHSGVKKCCSPFAVDCYMVFLILGVFIMGSPCSLMDIPVREDGFLL